MPVTSSIIKPPEDLSLGALKYQYFIGYAILAAVSGMVPLLLEDRLGGSHPAMGWLLAINGLAIMVAPLLVGVMADAHFRIRTLLIWSYILLGIGCVGLIFFQQSWTLALAYVLYSFAVRPQGVLQDGLYFQIGHEAELRKQSILSYAGVRVFGSVGYLVAMLALGALLRYADMPVVGCMVIGGGMVLWGVFNLTSLPAFELPKRGKHAPLRLACRQLTIHKGWWLVFGMLLVQAGTVAYFSFLPAFITDVVNLDKGWVAWIIALGVALEIPPILWASRLISRYGMRRVMLCGLVLHALRCVLLGMFPGWWALIFLSLIHGPVILGIYVAVPILINRMAIPSCRNSMQAMYTIIGVGVGVVFGNLLLAWVRRTWDLQAVFYVSGVIVALGTLVIWIGHRDSSLDGQAKETEVGEGRPSASACGRDV